MPHLLPLRLYWHHPLNIAGAVDTVAARAGVAALLREADAAVAARGLRIKVLDAYRSVETQAGLWSFFSDQVSGRAARPR